jgi:hypothetical protein
MGSVRVRCKSAWSPHFGVLYCFYFRLDAFQVCATGYVGGLARDAVAPVWSRHQC